MRRYSPNLSGRNPLESVAGIKWNHWPESRGIGGRNHVESVAGILWNMHPKTAIYEIRPKTNEYITVGKFKINEELEIFDISSPYIKDPFACGEDMLAATLKHLSFFRMLGQELSKPIDPKEKELKYLPSQYLCEYIKKANYDGIKYKSNLGEGYNITLFNDTKVKCTRSSLYKVEANPILI